jgi:hypothetical protein
MTPKEEERAKEYREFMHWARVLLADSVIKHGFAELNACVMMILNAHEQLKKKFP